MNRSAVCVAAIISLLASPACGPLVRRPFTASPWRASSHAGLRDSVYSQWARVITLLPRATVEVGLVAHPAELPLLESPGRRSTRLGTSIARQYRGTLLKAEPDRIVIRIDQPRSGRLTVQRSAVRFVDRLEIYPDDNLIDGAFIGMAVGLGVLGLLDLISTDYDMMSDVNGPAAFGAGGMALGLAADTAHPAEDRERIYELATSTQR